MNTIILNALKMLNGRRADILYVTIHLHLLRILFRQERTIEKVTPTCKLLQNKPIHHSQT